jgi:hypothetical protein
VQLVGLAVEDDGVAGVVAAVVADNDVVLGGQEVDDFTLGLIAPRQADAPTRRRRPFREPRRYENL